MNCCESGFGFLVIFSIFIIGVSVLVSAVSDHFSSHSEAEDVREKAKIWSALARIEKELNKKRRK